MGMYPILGLDPDSHPPTNIFQKFMGLLHGFMRWTKTAEAVVRPITSSFCIDALTRWLQVRLPICAPQYSALAPSRV